MFARFFGKKEEAPITTPVGPEVKHGSESDSTMLPVISKLPPPHISPKIGPHSGQHPTTKAAVEIKNKDQPITKPVGPEIKHKDHPITKPVGPEIKHKDQPITKPVGPEIKHKDHPITKPVGPEVKHDEDEEQQGELRRKKKKHNPACPIELPVVKDKTHPITKPVGPEVKRTNSNSNCNQEKPVEHSVPLLRFTETDKIKWHISDFAHWINSILENIDNPVEVKKVQCSVIEASEICIAVFDTMIGHQGIRTSP